MEAMVKELVLMGARKGEGEVLKSEVDEISSPT
jgi:hypothetical protein